MTPPEEPDRGGVEGSNDPKDGDSNSDALEQEFLENTPHLVELDETGSGVKLNLDTTVSPDLQKMVHDAMARRAEAQEAKETAESLRKGARIKYKLALTEIHRRLLKPGGDDRQAQRLSFRHNQHLVSKSFIQAVLKQRGIGSSSPCEELQKIIDDSARFGFFLFPYSVEEMQQRLEATQTGVRTPRYYIVDAYAAHPDPSHERHSKNTLAADCHIQVPDAQRDAQLVMEAPGEGDEIHDQDWVRDVLEKKPWSIASVDDIQCLRSMSGIGMAAAAMQSAMTVVARDENPNRQGFEIEHMTAAIATLQGISTPEGEDIRLSEDLNIAPIPNGRSHVLFDHFRHDNWNNFSTAYVLKNRRYPFQIDGEDYEIIVDWWMKHSRLKK